MAFHTGRRYQVEWDVPGVAEVQTVTTSTYLGANELQTIRTARTRTRSSSRRSASAQRGAVGDGDGAGRLDGGHLRWPWTRGRRAACPVHGASRAGRGKKGRRPSSPWSRCCRTWASAWSRSEDVSIDGRAGFQWQIQFNETLADLPQLQVLDASGLTLGSTVTVATETEGNAISGTFRLTFGGDTTALIAADATAGEVEDALELLDTVTDVTVVRGDAASFGGFSWWVTLSTTTRAATSRS